MVTRNKAEGFRSVTFETQRGDRIIFHPSCDTVTVIPAYPVGSGAFTVPADAFVAALEESRRLRAKATE